MRYALVLTLTVLVGAGVGCGAAPLGPEPEACPANKVSLGVSAGTHPLLTWTPRCCMVWLTARDSTTRSTVRDVTGRGNHLPSGLRYGGPLPSEVTMLLPAEDLEPGRAYTVVVSRLVCADPARGVLCSLLEAASPTFTP